MVHGVHLTYIYIYIYILYYIINIYIYIYIIYIYICNATKKVLMIGRSLIKHVVINGYESNVTKPRKMAGSTGFLLASTVHFLTHPY